MKLVSKVIVLFGFAATLSASALADSRPDPAGSKENTSIEAQGEGRLPDLKRYGVLTDGSFQATYLMQYTDPKTSKAIDLSLETTLIGNFDGTSMSNIRKMLFPIETRVRFNASDLSDIDLRAAKIGFLKLMNKQAGLTLQLASFIYMNRDAGVGEGYGAEIFDFTVDEAIALTRNREYEWIVKGSVRAGVIKDLVVRTNPQAFHDVTAYGAASLSSGLRISKDVLIEIFGSSEWDQSLEQKDRFIRSLSYGGNATWKFMRQFSVQATGKVDHYLVTSGNVDDSTKVVGGYLTIGFNW